MKKLEIPPFIHRRTDAATDNVPAEKVMSLKTQIRANLRQQLDHTLTRTTDATDSE